MLQSNWCGEDSPPVRAPPPASLTTLRHATGRLIPYETDASDGMVPDPPTTSRRRLLAGFGGGVAALVGGTVALGATEPTALPDRLTDAATVHYPEPPETATLWRPTVTEAHAREAVELLAETSERADELWPRVDVDEPTILGPPVAGGWLETAREHLREEDYPRAVFDAIYGIQFAGESLGFARGKLDRVGWQALADRATSLQERARAVTTALQPYPTTVPRRDLAWYARIEQAAQVAGTKATRAVPEPDRQSEDPDPDALGEATATLLQARLYVREAERFRELLSARVDGETTPFRDRLAAVVERFRSDLAEYPGRDAVMERYFDRDADEYGPWEFAHSRLARWCFDSSRSLSVPWETTIDEELLALRAVALSIGLARRRAHGRVVDRLVVEPDDTGFDSGHTLAAKRRAQSTYRSVVGSDPSPLLVAQIGRAVEDIQVAEVRPGDPDDDRPAWRRRLKPYLYALLGRAKLQVFPPLRDAILGRE